MTTKVHVKGVACRSCKHATNDGQCVHKRPTGMDCKEDCWIYQNKNQSSVVAEHSDPGTTWN